MDTDLTILSLTMSPKSCSIKTMSPLSLKLPPSLLKGKEKPEDAHQDQESHFSEVVASSSSELDLFIEPIIVNL